MRRWPSHQTFPDNQHHQANSKNTSESCLNEIQNLHQNNPGPQSVQRARSHLGPMNKCETKRLEGRSPALEWTRETAYYATQSQNEVELISTQQTFREQWSTIDQKSVEDNLIIKLRMQKYCRLPKASCTKTYTETTTGDREYITAQESVSQQKISSTGQRLEQSLWAGTQRHQLTSSSQHTMRLLWDVQNDRAIQYKGKSRRRKTTHQPARDRREQNVAPRSVR